MSSRVDSRPKTPGATKGATVDVPDEPDTPREGEEVDPPDCDDDFSEENETPVEGELVGVSRKSGPKQ